MNQNIVRRQIEFPGAWRVTKDPAFGNELLVANLPSATEPRTAIVRYEVIRNERGPAATAEAPGALDLQPERLVPKADLFQTLAVDLTARQIEPLAQARTFNDHLFTEMRYNKSGTG